MLRMCVKPLERCLGRRSGDVLLWHNDLKPHSSGDFSIAVVQANSNLEDQSQIGPLRCWPGGLCLSRSIGDLDVGEFIVPVPYVKQVKLSSAGGRLIIASDGVWDALSAEAAIECSRGMPPNAVAGQIVKEAVQPKGLRDDTTCMVVDIMPAEKINPPVPQPRKKGVFKVKAMFRKKSTESTSQIEEYLVPDVVEELVEEGSARLSERFVS
ncbi:hypothetical protein SSX86_006894 [Deinandra increscens subsp. villosa]|uniref:PPM-type phosphatase domain-containing protein n=1 Tax=Deinandra increscens subsp. villosa TaxID=3103831 RepID=A0AAP0DKF2_9ASTR